MGSQAQAIIDGEITQITSGKHNEGNKSATIDNKDKDYVRTTNKHKQGQDQMKDDNKWTVMI